MKRERPLTLDSSAVGPPSRRISQTAASVLAASASDSSHAAPLPNSETASPEANQTAAVNSGHKRRGSSTIHATAIAVPNQIGVLVPKFAIETPATAK